MESIAGQILALYDVGYSAAQIVAELKSRGTSGVSLGRVQATIRQSQSRSLDSRRIFEIHEMNLQILGIVKELLAERKLKNARAHARTLEKGGLAKIVGAAIEGKSE